MVKQKSKLLPVLIIFGAILVLIGLYFSIFMGTVRVSVTTPKDNLVIIVVEKQGLFENTRESLAISDGNETKEEFSTDLSAYPSESITTASFPLKFQVIREEFFDMQLDGTQKRVRVTVTGDGGISREILE